MNFNYGTVAQILPEARESPVIMIPGVDTAWSWQFDGTGTLVASSMALYENGLDVSATKLSGSMTVSGRTIVGKTVASVVGGSTYKAYLYYTDGGLAQVREATFIVPKLGEPPSRHPNATDLYKVMDSPLEIYPSQSVTYSLIVDGQGTLASPTMYVYKKYTDDSANVLSGALSISGRTITLKTISGLSGGSEYIAYVYFTDNGKATVRYFQILCPRLGAY